MHRPNALQLVDRPILPFNVQVGGRVGRHSGRPAHSRRKTTITISASHLKDTTRKFSTIVALRVRNPQPEARTESPNGNLSQENEPTNRIPIRHTGQQPQSENRAESKTSLQQRPNPVAIHQASQTSDSIQSQPANNTQPAETNSNQPIQPHQPIIPQQPPARHTRHGSQPERKKTWSQDLLQENSN